MKRGCPLHPNVEKRGEKRRVEKIREKLGSVKNDVRNERCEGGRVEMDTENT